MNSEIKNKVSAGRVEYELCILIPYFNNFEGLIQSISSISYEQGKYLILIVDDGSEVPLAAKCVQKQLSHLVPMEVLVCAQNGGITSALNKGLYWIKEHTNVTYIARLDCGDSCAPDRFYKQVGFLNSNSEVGLVGSWCKFKSADGRMEYNYITPTSHADIVKEMHLRNVFIHPAAVFRASILDEVGVYSEEYEFVEDYALFWSMLKVTKGAIIKEFLVTCEINKKGISISRRKRQLLARAKVVQEFSSNKLLKAVGLSKLYIMLYTPYNLVLRIKTLKRYFNI